jgi:hypothetical protein
MTATTTGTGKPLFSPREQQRLLEDDMQCSKTVLAVLLSVVTAGALAMAVTVILVL